MENYRITFGLVAFGEKASLPEAEYVDAVDYLREEWRNAQGQIHSAHGPAVIARCPKTHGIIGMYWFRAGKLHRDEGPAIINTGEEQQLDNPDRPPTLVRRWWFSDGLQHRDGAPSHLVTGEFDVEEWTVRGKKHREGGPAYYRREDGVVISEDWCLSGLPHRVDGPATIRRHWTSAVIEEESWYLNGQLHRIGGPAYIGRDHLSGELQAEEFHKYGVEVAPEVVGATRRFIPSL